MAKRTKIVGICAGSFVIFAIIGIAYESFTGLNMLTGEKKTSGVGADKWIKQGEIDSPKLTTSEPTVSEQSNSEENQCDSSYPTICIPPYSPDLDCGEISYRNFKVLQPDPHGFDRDNDGIGCEG